MKSKCDPPEMVQPKRPRRHRTELAVGRRPARRFLTARGAVRTSIGLHLDDLDRGLGIESRRSRPLIDRVGRRPRLRTQDRSATRVSASERSAAMNCRETIDLLSEYLDGALPWRRRALVWIHLRLCRDCRNYVASFRRTLVLARATARDVASDPPPAIPDELVQAIQAARAARK